MIFFDWKCRRGHEFEAYIEKYDSDPPLCPECQSETVKMVSAPMGFILKGDGFHRNDYKELGPPKKKKKKKKYLLQGENRTEIKD